MLDKNILIIGCGGKTQEVIKIFCALCEIHQKEMII